jgi:glycosyltransferase involved in cell wall biosynthesis
VKLLCATQFYPPSNGGMQLSNLLLVEGLVAAGANVELHLFSADTVPAFVTTGLRCCQYTFQPRSLLEHFSCARIISHATKAFKPKAVLLLDDSMVRSFGVMPRVTSNGVSLISINSGATPTRKHSGLKSYMNAALVRRGYRWLDLLFVSDSTANTLPSVCPEVQGRIRTLGRPIPNEYFAQGNTEVSFKFFDNDLPTLFSCARAVEEKGISLVIKALAVLRDESGNEIANFIYAGEGPALEAWQALAKELSLKNVHFLGWQSSEQLAGYYRASYMCIFPSYYSGETFGRTWAEAFAFGKPVISTLTENLRFLVLDGVNGLSIAPDIDGVVQGIRRALNLTAPEYREMCKQARASAEPFRQSAIVNKLLHAIEGSTKVMCRIGA